MSVDAFNLVMLNIIAFGSVIFLVAGAALYWLSNRGDDE